MKLEDLIKRLGVGGCGPHSYQGGTCPVCGKELRLYVDDADKRSLSCKGSCKEADILTGFGLNAVALLEHIDFNVITDPPPKLKHNGQNGQNGQNEAFKSPPVRFSEDKLPAFPVDALPPVLREFSVAVADSLQVPEDMTAVCALAVCALAVQKKFKIKGKEDWQEPLNLYTAMIAAPGERKSAVTSIMVAPVFEYENAQNDAIQGLVDEYQVKHSILVKQVKGLEDAAARANAKPGAADKAVSKRRELAELEEKEPRLLRLWTDDATPEAMTSLMADHGGKIAVISAEGGLFDTLNGRYTTGVNIDVVLKAHAGDSVRVDRKGRPSEYIQSPAMTVFLAIQPHVLDGIMGNEAFRGRGLTARFLYSMPVTKVGERDFDTKPIPQHLTAGYHNLVQSLLTIRQKETEDIINLSPEAAELSRTFFYELEPKLRDDLEGMADWANKLHGAILRIAGVLHVIQHQGAASYRAVSVDVMQDAITIGKYFLEHSKAAYKLMGADKATADAKFILRKIEKRDLQTVTRRDLHRLCRPYFKEPEAMTPALELLEEYRYIAELPAEYNGIGKPPSPKYSINPHLYGQNGLNGQNP